MNINSLSLNNSKKDQLAQNDLQIKKNQQLLKLIPHEYLKETNATDTRDSYEAYDEIICIFSGVVVIDFLKSFVINNRNIYKLNLIKQVLPNKFERF